MVKNIFFKKTLSTLLAFFSASFLFAQIPSNGLDIKHYSFRIILNDSNNIIKGNAVITAAFTKDVNKVVLDLVQKNKEGKGMTVTSVTKNNTQVNFVQDSQHVIINDKGFKGKENIYSISYEGVPADGLIISNTQYGNRSSFADNWPNRAHNWIPCNDHLSDKATVEFLVTAPSHYEVVSNGAKVEETALTGNMKFTHWKENIELPTKVMVIGVTDFAINNIGNVDCIPVSSWVFPQDRDRGFQHYAIAKEILKWYITRIGPYAYEKLANVQSKTIFGGMENAGCIFYFENSANAKGIESLFAHEIAHQWFGDYATEKDWPHLWLSEGFATYMTDLYFENKYSKDTLLSMLADQRKQVLNFYKRVKTPVVDTSGKDDLMHLLNANSYQKGAWVLHMLRRKIGDTIFWKGIQAYYKMYGGSNANTDDLRKVFEKVSGKDLQSFFEQWLYQAGQPTLTIEWSYNKAKKTATVTVEQTQEKLFDFPLEIAFTNGTKKIVKTINVNSRVVKKEIPLAIIPAELIADPEVNLLFTAEIKKL